MGILVIIGFLTIFGFGAWDQGVVSFEDGASYNSECWNQSCGSKWNDTFDKLVNRGN